ncbi:CAP domain-containing protein [Virgibacillus kekensis]|uniref:CAP domain-containing protein n=1 Tax=Virgibacillus kekensis TaxID=202261 RepID=A0ABV9DF17_9BACI
MRLSRLLALLLLVVISGFYFLEKNDLTPEQAVQNINTVVEEKKNVLKTKAMPAKRSIIPLEGDLYRWIGKPVKELSAVYGKPAKEYESPYGYQWLVYTQSEGQYIQFGVKDNKIASIYAIGDELSLEPIQIGQSYDSLKENFSFTNEVTYSEGLSSYTFKLKDEELRSRPLVKITDNYFIQLYFDSFTGKLSSVRVLSGDILLLHRPYGMEYRGSLPEKPSFSDKEWNKIEADMEQQIFDITNIIRFNHGKPALKWDETVSNVAYLHSKDMAQNNYFSHYGLDGDGLKERLAAEEVFYRSAGENIAAQYPDAPSAMHGWLNSKGHREALLKDDYTHLGVGVYRFYYTQNFLKIQ